MKYLLCVDSFKGSLTSMEAGNAIADGIREADPTSKIEVIPMADGGEGTLCALTEGLHGRYKTVTVTGPLGEPVNARYGIADQTAIIEMAEASGLILVKDTPDVLSATTYGTGELIKDAINEGIRDFLICIGGSATNDGGTGMLEALGARFEDAKGEPVKRGAAGLKDLKSIDLSGLMSELKECRFKVACDVDNPLCGPNGASMVFGPQKGATQELAEQMDEWLQNYAGLTKEMISRTDETQKGSGAAGGMGFALRTFLNAELLPGAEIVMEKTGAIDKIRSADIVITGEGRTDASTLNGKAPMKVAGPAKGYGKRAVIFCGIKGTGADKIEEQGIEVIEVKTEPQDKDPMDPETAKKNLRRTAGEVFGLI